VTSTNAINATVYDRLNYDLIRGIAPVAGTVRLPSVMVVTPSFFCGLMATHMTPFPRCSRLKGGTVPRHEI
jgi:hypothetical protein